MGAMKRQPDSKRAADDDQADSQEQEDGEGVAEIGRLGKLEPCRVLVLFRLAPVESCADLTRKLPDTKRCAAEMKPTHSPFLEQRSEGNVRAGGTGLVCPPHVPLAGGRTSVATHRPLAATAEKK